jgi:F-type H+-transporting ATPase subunit a
MSGLLAAAAQEEESPILQLIEHLTPHRYSWAPEWKFGSVDMSFTNAVLNIWLAAAAVIIIFYIAAQRPRIVPRGLQNAIELSNDLLKDRIVYGVMRPADARTWFPFVAAVFYFVLFMNVIGLIPVIGFTPTANIYVTGALALVVFLLAISIGMARNGVLKFWSKSLLPPGVPKPLIPLMVVIEVFSYLFRPVSLAARLFANMFADHIILLIFVGFIFLAGTTFAVGHLFIVPIAMVFEIVFTMFGLFVAFIQAVIFAFLTTIYINDALHPGH